MCTDEDKIFFLILWPPAGEGEGIVHRQILIVPSAKSQALLQTAPLHNLKKITHFPLFYHKSGLL